MSRASLSPRTVDEAFHNASVQTIKALAMDAVEQANSGHPGMPMGTAEMATTLWTRFLVHDPKTPRWPDRDRFVLSAGHGSMLLYSLLHLSGYDLGISDLQNFRQLHSKTPGHPEYGHTDGVEVTTGPLGTGFGTGVGLALAERVLADHFNRDGHAIVDHFTYGIVSDGDLMEGVASEAASFAGHQKLGKLIYLYDDNQISIDGGTELAFTEDVGKRFEAYGWQVLRADGHDAASIHAALVEARGDASRPTIICCRTVIGHGSPNMQGTSATHGAPLGAQEVAATKAAMGWDHGAFTVPEGVREGYGAVAKSGAEARADWEKRFAAYQKAHPELAAAFEQVMDNPVGPGAFENLPKFEVGASIATRKAQAKILAALHESIPTLIGGSADLAGSNGVNVPGLTGQQASNPSGRTLHFGVREHGMATIANGLALHGGLATYDATFLVFSDFMRGGIRLSALMGLPVVHVLSHDSIWLGEDGPTHQPVEHTMSLRLIPNLHVVRPADAKETIGAWKHALTRGDGPTAILVSRQGLPVLEGSRDDLGRGGYVVQEGKDPANLDGILIATGSEVSLACEAASKLAGQGKSVRVVSMPCWKMFEAQDEAYRESVLPAAVTRRVSVEAGTTVGWHRYAPAQVGIDTFGASAPGEQVAAHFGFTVDNVIATFEGG